MIATILHSSPTFNAVLYNERKVAQGCATLLELKNFGAIDILGYDNPSELQSYLLKYSSMNSRIKKPQFHLAISCKGHEWTEEDLVSFAHSYLEEMGYGNPDQPLLIYAHRDTDNTHIHVITSRVSPDGKKINDSKERIRSQKTIEKLLGQNAALKTEQDIKTALSFNFKTLTQFKAVLEAMKYECYEKDGEIYVKKGGMVQSKVNISVIKQQSEMNKSKISEPSQYMKWRGIIKKYRDLNSSKTGLEQDLRAKFGLAIIWFGKKDSPYGYAVVDFKNKTVLEGSKILPIKQLLDFKTPEEHAEQIELLIDDCLISHPLITTMELNKLLRKIGGFVKKDVFLYGNHKQLLKPWIAERLKRNNKIEWLNSFCPTTEEERNVLCRLFEFNAHHMIDISTPKMEDKQIGDELRRISGIEPQTERIDVMHKAGFHIVESEGRYYFVNQRDRFIASADRLGLSDSEINRLKNFKPMRHPVQTANTTLHSMLQTNTINRKRNYGRSDNREWEVGKKEIDRDDPDRTQGVSY